MRASTISYASFVHGYFKKGHACGKKRFPLLRSFHSLGSSSEQVLIWNDRIVFPTVVDSGSLLIDLNSGTILESHQGECATKAEDRASSLGGKYVNLQKIRPGGILAPGLIDVHTHISALGRDWEGYESATKAAAAGGITTIMGMPLNSVPATTTLDAVKEEVREAQFVDLLADVGLWGGVVPDSINDLPALLTSPYIFGIKAFLSPLPPAAGYSAVSPSQLHNVASLCGPRGLPILVHSELMTETEIASALEESFSCSTNQQDSSNSHSMYEAHVLSRPAEWERRAVEVVCRLSQVCHMHIVHLSDSGCLPMISHTKDLASSQLTVETCPHYLLFDQSTIEEESRALVDTRFKCFPPIRDARNREILLSEGLGFGLIDMLGSDHSPCTPEMRLRETGDLKGAWGGLSGLQYQFASSWQALTSSVTAQGKPEDSLAPDFA